MFFGIANFEAELLSVIELSWDKVNANAGFRPFYTLSFRLEGDASFYKGEEKLLRVDEAEITYVPEKYDFSKRAEKGRIIAIHFTSKSPLPDEILSFRPKNPSLYRSEFIRLYQVWNKKQLGYIYESKIIFYSIILALEKEWASSTPSVANEKLRVALDYIHQHFSDGEVSVSNLAAMCGMSDTYFRRLFVTEFSITPLRYINKLRMTRIRELLEANYSSIEDISELCGFNNVNYFSLFVKKETGMSPLKYRKHLLSEKDALR